MMPFGYKRPPYDQEKAEKPTHHWSWDLLPRERQILLDWLEKNKVPPERVRKYLARKLHEAQCREGAPLPTVPNLDWHRAEKAARARGSSVPEWIEDGAPEPPDQAA